MKEKTFLGFWSSTDDRMQFANCNRLAGGLDPLFQGRWRHLVSYHYPQAGDSKAGMILASPQARIGAIPSKAQQERVYTPKHTTDNNVEQYTSVWFVIHVTQSDRLVPGHQLTCTHLHVGVNILHWLSTSSQKITIILPET